MTVGSPFSACVHSDLVELFAIGALSPAQEAEFTAHLDDCNSCRREIKSLEPVVKSFAAWPGCEIAPRDSVWSRVANNIGLPESDARPLASLPELLSAGWEQPAPGIFCKILSTDDDAGRVSMLVRLEPGVAYPSHRHVGFEELHLLDGELWIDDRMLVAGDFNRAEPGTKDDRVWSARGCTCVLTTSLADILL